VHRVIFGEESGSAYHTSWYMVMRWRAAMRGDVMALAGIVEIDETYIGGKDRNRHWAKKSRQQRDAGTGEGYLKTGVIGAIARKGNVVCKVIGNIDARTKSSFVRQIVDEEKLELVATDENPTYDHLGQGIRHEAVNHSQGEYVRGEVHTNNIESFWSLIKRGVMGNFHHVSKEYLPLYLNEFSWRFNNRRNPNMFADLIQGVGRQ